MSKMQCFIHRHIEFGQTNEKMKMNGYDTASCSTQGSS